MDQSFRTSVCKKTLPQVKRRYTLERILSCGVLFHTVKTLFTDTCLIQTPHYGQFVLSLGKECPYILSKFNRLNTDTSFIRTLFMVPSLFALTGCGCTLYFTLYRVVIIQRFYRDSTVLHDPMPWIIPVFWHFAIFWLNHQVDLKTCTVRNTSGKSNRELRVINWIHCQPFYENRKKQAFALFTPLLHSNNMVTLPCQQGFLFAMVLASMKSYS